MLFTGALKGLSGDAGAGLFWGAGVLSNVRFHLWSQKAFGVVGCQGTVTAVLRHLMERKPQEAEKMNA